MADLLKVGVEFESFEAFQAAMEHYEDNKFVQFSRIDSRSVEKAQEFSPIKTYNPQIQFTQLTYACTYGPRKVASKSSGIRSTSSRKIDCPVRLRISSTPDGQRLVIRESKLDGHNHEISEELYKSMSRQKQLDEETELEIYNLISAHNDKRLARMLVRDRLTQEMGRSISVKDILNIEKKIARRLDREKVSLSTSFCETGGKEEETEPSEVENASEDVVEPETGPHAEETETADVDDDQEKTELASQEGKEEHQTTEEDRDTGTHIEPDSNNSEMEPPPKKVKDELEPVGAPRRPQRHRREPSRFRDPLANVRSKVLQTSHNKAVSILTPQEFQDLGSEVREAASVMCSKMKDEPRVRGRKRKVDQDKNSSYTIESEEEEEETRTYRQQKLSIQEQLLELEKRKMQVLDNIVEKLDIIIKNQEKQEKG